jgi:hypothetical protein
MAKLISIARTMGLAACGLTLAGMTGCRNLDNAQVDVLERELRQQEDYIYELEDYLVEYSEKLRQCRMAANCHPMTSTKAGAKSKTIPEPTLMHDKPRAASPQNGRKASAPPSAAEAATDDAATPPATEPAVEPVTPDAEAVDPKEMEVPDVEFGSETGKLQWKTKPPVASSPELLPAPAEEAPLYLPDPVDYETDAAAPPEYAVQQAMESDEPILAAPALTAPRLSPQRLHIRRVFGERPENGGDSLDRLLVVVEALNATDEPVDAPGETSLMVMVRDESGSLQRVHRWDFTAEETAAAWQSSHLGDGLHLELPLEGRELPAGELELWARMVDHEGQKLLANAPLEPAQLTSVANAAPPDSAPDEPSPAATERRLADAPKWRAASQRLDPSRIEGYASTAAGSRGWTAQSAKTQESAKTQAARVANARAEEAPPPSNAPAKWSPFR